MDLKDLIKEGIIEQDLESPQAKQYTAETLYKLVDRPLPCEDCGLLVDVTTRKVRWSKNQHPFMHWKKGCNKCKLYLNPDSGKYEFTQFQINEYYRNNKAK